MINPAVAKKYSLRPFYSLILVPFILSNGIQGKRDGGNGGINSCALRPLSLNSPSHVQIHPHVATGAEVG
jgi:hypothetical protein